jgi:SAM-dependent methyltransferase
MIYLTQGHSETMTATAKPTSVDQVREIWRSALPEETDFWKQWFETKGLQWKDSYAWRTDPNYEFQKDLRPYVSVPEGGTVRVLDVGAGPLTVLGKVWPGHKLDLVAVDPLAEQYDKIMAEVGMTPLVRTRAGHGERLLDIFPPSSFDPVYASNCLDHSYNPILCLQQMFAVVKPGCWVVTDHLTNEGKSNKYEGLHQWNFTVEKWRFWRQGRFVIWRPGTKLDVQEQLGKFAMVKAVVNTGVVDKRNHTCAWIKKLA